MKAFSVVALVLIVSLFVADFAVAENNPSTSLEKFRQSWTYFVSTPPVGETLQPRICTAQILTGSEDAVSIFFVKHLDIKAISIVSLLVDKLSHIGDNGVGL